MDTLLFVVKLLAGPIVGAVIGLFTNYIAIKMMFRPRRAHYIGKLHIPFTPGIIPHRKAALASALGHMISESLVRKEDLKKALLSDGVTNAVVGGILALPSIKDSGANLLGEDYAKQRDKLLDAATNRIVNAAGSLDLAAILTKEGAAALSGMGGRNPLIAMFFNESTIASFAPALAERILAYLEGDGRAKIKEMLSREAEKLELRPLGELFGDSEKLTPVIAGLYRKLVSDHADAIASRFHISRMVEKRINAMPPEDLERLVLSVMKKELDAVIYLGAGLGFLLGIITTLIGML
ncbi:MAG: DUF445 family protein [Ruminococcaceae bacterium]|nr:DUF445 family protein [Oscillospiraceae bacterium]